MPAGAVEANPLVRSLGLLPAKLVVLSNLAVFVTHRPV